MDQSLTIIDPEPLVFHDGDAEQRLRNEIESDDFNGRCPCDAVAEYLLPQPKIYGIFVEYEQRGRLRCIPNQQIDLARSQRLDRFQPVSPEGRTEEVTFIRCELVDNLPAVVDLAAVQQFLELATLVRRFFSSYEIGPRLRDQPGSEPFRRDLRRATDFLCSIGLIDRSIARSNLSHSSTILVTRRALGLRRLRDLQPFLESPVHFFSATILASFPTRARESVAAELADVLMDSNSYWLPPDSHPLVTSRFCMAEEDASRMLLRILKSFAGHANIVRGVRRSLGMPRFEELLERQTLEIAEILMQDDWLGLRMLDQLEQDASPAAWDARAVRTIARLTANELVQAQDHRFVVTRLGHEVLDRIDTLLDATPS